MRGNQGNSSFFTALNKWEKCCQVEQTPQWQEDKYLKNPEQDDSSRKKEMTAKCLPDHCSWYSFPGITALFRGLQPLGSIGGPGLPCEICSLRCWLLELVPLDVFQCQGLEGRNGPWGGVWNPRGKTVEWRAQKFRNGCRYFTIRSRNKQLIEVQGWWKRDRDAKSS